MTKECAWWWQAGWGKEMKERCGDLTQMQLSWQTKATGSPSRLIKDVKRMRRNWNWNQISKGKDCIARSHSNNSSSKFYGSNISGKDNFRNSTMTTVWTACTACWPGALFRRLPERDEYSVSGHAISFHNSPFLIWAAFRLTLHWLSHWLRRVRSGRESQSLSSAQSALAVVLSLSRSNCCCRCSLLSPRRLRKIVFRFSSLFFSSFFIFFFFFAFCCLAFVVCHNFCHTAVTRTHSHATDTHTYAHRLREACIIFSFAKVQWTSKIFALHQHTHTCVCQSTLYAACVCDTFFGQRFRVFFQGNLSLRVFNVAACELFGI